MMEEHSILLYTRCLNHSLITDMKISILDIMNSRKRIYNESFTLNGQILLLEKRDRWRAVIYTFVSSYEVLMLSKHGTQSGF